jgi:outer membrane receptor for ferrienterochelin and colicin
MVKRLVHMRRTLIVALATLLMLPAGAALAGDTGKISGTVRDKKTGEALIGANVAVKGTNLGASTDVNGFYYILRVPPGMHEVTVTLVGYSKTTVSNVRVQNDLTAEINIKLDQSTVELNEVTVTAEQKLVQKDVTSTRRTVSRETIQSTPGMTSATDVFKLQAGAIFSATPPTLTLANGTQIQVRDQSLKDIHIRGGRGGEILYMVDGMPVTHPIYGGRSVVDLNLVDVDNVELLTGGFNAEYGQAQSGVVNITTRSGGEHFKGGVEYNTDRWEFLGTSENTDYASLYLSGPEPITQSLLPAIGLNLPGSVGFFLSGNFNLTNGPYDNHRTRGKVKILGMDFTEHQENDRNLNGKLTWDMTGSHHLALSYHGSWKQWSDFDWSWRDHPDNTALWGRVNHAANALFNHVLSKSTYYTLNFGYLGVRYRGSHNGMSPSQYWVADSSGKLQSTVQAPQIDPGTGFYDAPSVDATWRDDKTNTYTFKGDFTSQVHPAHLLKTGVEFQYNDLSYIDIEDGATHLSRYGLGLDPLPPPGPYPEFGLNRWVFHVKPMIGSAYIQDKFELEYLVLNAGVRADYFYLGKTVMGAEWKDLWTRATGLTPNWKSSIYKFSPRFGVSFPISERTVVFFSYGHFNQLPELQYFYRDPYSGAFAGNPGLDYEQTILYEFGATHQISDEWVIDVKSYAKDISKQIASTTVRGAEGLPVELYDNKSYGRARGLEFELSKSYADYISGKATYTLQWATGYSSSAFDDYIRSTTNFPYPIRERPVDWDVRQQLIVQTTVSAPRDQYPSIFGFTLPDDWNLTLLFRWGTGTPYTPGDATLNPVEAQRRDMTATGPSTSQTDLKFEKGFTLAGIRVAVTMDIFNLFNQENVQTVSGGYGFNTWTGRPYRYGDIERPQPNIYDYYRIQSLMNPYVISQPRWTKVGLRVDF